MQIKKSPDNNTLYIFKNLTFYMTLVLTHCFYTIFSANNNIIITITLEENHLHDVSQELFVGLCSYTTHERFLELMLK
jgi:hypothetical protein